MKNQVRLTKKFNAEKKKREVLEQKSTQVSTASKKKEQEKEAQRRLDAEIAHQKEEAETRALGKAMMQDGAKNRPGFSNSCMKLLNNFQGINYNIAAIIEFLKANNIRLFIFNRRRHVN